MTFIKQQMTTLKQHRFLVIVAIVYGILLLVAPDLALKGLSNSVYYLVEMLMIMPVIFLLTIALEVLVSKDAIIKHMGEGSGFSGNTLALILGSISAGPIYAAFPLCKTLYQKGSSVANLVIVLSAWAVIKVPMLANESKFLGVDFMIMRWLLTVAAILVMGYSVQVILKGKLEIATSADALEATTLEDRDHMLKVDHQKCIGCSLCAKKHPSFFEMDFGKAIFKKGAITSQKDQGFGIKSDLYQELALLCPVQAISVHIK